MVSKAKEKFIKSLQLKKNRKQAQSFLVEGGKSVLELLSADFTVQSILATDRFVTDHPILENYTNLLTITSESALVRMGTFQSNNAALAIAEMKENTPPSMDLERYILVLDDVRDPGNLGTIIRIADWYGMKHIVASRQTADCYNPKVIHASMGSFARVQLYYTELPSFLKEKKWPLYATDMQGTSVHDMTFDGKGLVLMGNEAHGISADLQKYVDHTVAIPRFGEAESLNVAVASAIVCDNLMRNQA